MYIHAHFQGLQPLDWALLTCKKAQDKNHPSYNPIYSKVLIIALPIFEAYEALYCLIATSVCALQAGTTLIVNRLNSFKIFYVDFLKDLGQGILHLERAALLTTALLITLVTADYFLCIVSPFAKLLNLHFSHFLYSFILWAHSFHRHGGNRISIIANNKIRESIEPIKYDFGDCIKGIGKTVVYSFNVFISPLFLLMSPAQIENYHKKIDLVASKPTTFRELHKIANRVNNFEGFSQLVSKNRCNKLILKELSQSGPLIGCLNIIENPRLSMYVQRMVPKIFKDLSQLRVTNLLHTYTNFHNLTLSPLSHLCDQRSGDIAASPVNLFVDKRLKKYREKSIRGIEFIKKVILDFLLTSPEALMHEALGQTTYTPDNTNGQILVQTKSGLDAKRWTFLKYGLRNSYFHHFLSIYPYTQSKFKDMHHLQQIDSNLFKENFTIFKNMLLQDLPQFIASGESVEISILLNDRDLLNQIFRTSPSTFKTDMRKLIKKHPESQRALSQIREEIQNVLTLFSNKNFRSEMSDLTILTYR